MAPPQSQSSSTIIKETYVPTSKRQTLKGNVLEKWMCLRQDQGVRKNFTSKIVFSIIAILLVLFTCLAVYGVMEWREREDARKAAEMGWAA